MKNLIFFISVGILVSAFYFGIYIGKEHGQEHVLLSGMVFATLLCWPAPEDSAFLS